MKEGSRLTNYNGKEEGEEARGREREMKERWDVER